MNIAKSFFWTWLFAVCVFPSTQAEFLHIACPNVPPLLYADKDGNPRGLVYDIFEQLITETDLEYTCQFYPLKRYYHVVSSGKSHFNIIAKGISPSIDQMLLYGKHPIMSLQINLYWKGGTKFTTGIENIDQLRNQRIAVVRGYHYSGILESIESSKNYNKIYEAHDHGAALHMLLSGRVSYLLGYSAIIKNFDREDSSQLSSTLISTTDLYIGISKALPNAAEILEKLEQAQQKAFPQQLR